MRKLFLIISFLLLTPVLNASAVEFKPYVGVDVGRVCGIIEDKANDHDSDCFRSRTKVGVNFGLKINVDESMFFFGETYINILNEDNEYRNVLKWTYPLPIYLERNIDLIFRNMYGLNFGLGRNYGRRFNVKLFVSVDTAEFKMSVTNNNLINGVVKRGDFYSKTKFGFGFGIELGYNITDDIEIRFSNKFSEVAFNLKKDFALGSREDRIELLKFSTSFGIAYKF